MASPIFDPGNGGGGNSPQEDEQPSWWDGWAPPDEDTNRGYYPQPEPGTYTPEPGQPTQDQWSTGPVNVPAPQRGYDPRWDDPNYGEDRPSDSGPTQFPTTDSPFSPSGYTGPQSTNQGTTPWSAPQVYAPTVTPPPASPGYGPNSYSGPQSQQQDEERTWADTWSDLTSWYNSTPGAKAAQEQSQNRWGSYEGATSTTGGREVDYFQKPTIENNSWVDWGVAGGAVQKAADVGTGALNLGVDAWNKFQSTETGDTLADKATAAGNYALDALDYFDSTVVKPIATEEVGNTGLSLGAAAESLTQGIANLYSPTAIAANEGNLVDTATAAVDATKARADQHKKARELVEELDEKGITDVNLALLRTYSGPEAIERAATAIATQGDNVTALQAEAQELQRQAAQTTDEDEAENLMYQAAVVGAKAEDLKNKSPLDLADEQASIWRELGFELVLDPTNAAGWVFDVLGLTTKAGQTRRAGKLVDGAPGADEAAQVLQKAYDEAVEASGDLGLAGTKGQINLLNLNPLTPQAQAEIATNDLYRSVAVIVGNAKTKADASTVLNALIDDPASLAEGIIDAAGGYLQKIGLGTLTDKSLVGNMDVLVEAKSDLKNLKALQGEGAFNPAMFMAEVDEALSQAAARVQGLKPARLPEGAVDVKKYTEGNGKTRLDYVDASGEVVESSTYTSAAAEKTYKQAKQAAKGDVPGQGWKTTEKVARYPSDLVRGLMSELWLNMRPNNWVKQAVGAVGHLAADGHNSFVRMGEVEDWFSTKYGVATPSRKTTDIVGLGEQLTGQVDSAVDQTNRSMFRNLTGGKQNPLSWWSEKGGEFWQNNELNFRKRATYSRAKQVFGQQWQRRIKDQFIPALVNAGLNEQQSRILGDLALDAGVSGGLEDVQRLVRGALDSPLETFSLRSLGIDDEVLSSSAIKDVYSLIAGRSDLSPDDFMRSFDEILTREQSRYGQILNDAPVTPRQYAWSAVDDVYDGPEIVDEMVTAAQRAGMDPAQARKEAEALTKGMTEGERAAYDRLLADAASSQDAGQLWAAADMWMEIRDLKQTYRQRVGDWARAAMDPEDPYTWDQYFNNAKDTWSKFMDDLPGISDQYRGQVNGAEGRRRYDAFDIMERHAREDWAQINANRLEGAGQAVGENAEQYQKVIDASRSYVDEFANNLYSTFKRYTSTDALELVTSAEQQVTRAGQQVAGYLAHLRSQAQDGAMMWGDYRRTRDKAWQEFSDAAAVMYNNATREVARRGVAGETSTGLAWTDEFAGGVFELVYVGENKNGRKVAFARNLDTGQLDEFALPGGGASDVPTRTYDATPETERLQQAQSELQGLQETRQQMAQQWYGTGTAEGGENSLDQIVATYKRNGIVNLPENFGEDLIGTNVLGVDVQSTADLERAIQSYADSADQIKNLQSEVKNLGSTAKPAGRLALPEIPDDVYRDWETVLNETDGALRGPGGLDEVDGLPAPDDLGFDPGDVAPRGADAPAPDANTGSTASREVDEYDPWDNLRQYRRENPTTVGENSTGIFGMEAGEDFADTMSQVNQLYQQTGGAYQPNPGDIASYYFDRLEDSRRAFAAKADQILKGGQELYSQEQRLRAIDALADLTGSWQDVSTAAIKAGDEAADMALLDYSQGRRLDKWMGLFVPYHYYYTRSMKNWARRTATRPDLLMNYQKVNNAAEDSNDSTALRTTGQIEVPVNDDMSLYVQNPLDLLLPFGSFGVNDFANPEEAQTGVGRFVENAKLLGFGLMPYLDAGVKAAEGRTDEIDFGDYVWQWRSAGYVKQALTGENLPGAGDMWDPYRAATKAAVDGQRNGTSPTDVAFAQDAIYQQQTGDEPLPEQAAMAPGAEGLATRYKQESGADRALTLVLRDLFGITVNPYATAEQELRDTSSQYSQLGYGEYGPFGPVNNPQGSKAATAGYFDANPQAGNWWGRSDLVPGAAEGEGFNRPGLDPVKGAAQEVKGTSRQSVYDAVAAGTDAYLASNPDASKSDINNAKKDAAIQAAAAIVGDEAMAQFLAENPSAWLGDIANFAADTAAQSQYPSADQFQYPDGGGRSPFRNMNPAESEEKLTEDAVRAAKKYGDAPVYPGQDASREEKAAYYDAKEQYEAGQETYLQSLLGMIESGDYEGLQQELYPGQNIGPEVGKQETFGPPTEAESTAMSRPGGPAGGTSIYGPSGPPEPGAASTSPTAADLLNANPYATEAEQQRLDELAAESAQKQADIDASLARIEAELGPEAAQKYREYMLAEDEARAQLKASDPQYKLFTMLAFEPENYADVKGRFGDGAWQEWANIPTWDGSPEQDQARREYFAANPRAKVVNAWVRGRPGGESTSGDPSSYNDWGNDFQEAQKRFGENIFQVWAGYNSGWDRATKRAYFDANPQLSEFNNWWYENLNSGQSSGAGASQGAGSGRGNFDRRAYVSSDGLVHYDRYGRRLDGVGNVARRTFGGGGGGGGSRDATSGIRNFGAVQRARLDPREMRNYGPTRAWEAPYAPNISAAINAGNNLAPGNLEAWRLPQRVPTLG